MNSACLRLKVRSLCFPLLFGLREGTITGPKYGTVVRLVDWYSVVGRSELKRESFFLVFIKIRMILRRDILDWLSASVSP